MQCVMDQVAGSASAICQKRDYVQDGDIVRLESNAIKKNKTLTLSADILSLGAVELRHGKNIFGASSIIIDATMVTCRHYTTEPKDICAFPHGLTIEGQTRIVASAAKDGTLSLTIAANGYIFSKQEIPWSGTNGSIELESVGTAMENLVLFWDCENYADAIWMFGDSYFTYYEERWPYYLLKQHDGFLLCGFPGAPSAAMYGDFLQALTHGTPKMAVWCLGMNDPDSEDGINASWQSYAERFLRECQERGIVPVLATVPNVPERIHCHKNAYIKKSGHRYIDFASAVGAEEKGSGWHGGMLSSDHVHPAAAGAQAMANQILLDLPEIQGQ